MIQRRTHRLPRSWLALMLVLGASVAASADTTLDVRAGWGDKIRPGRWTPLLVSAADTKPRNVVIEVYAAHDGSNALRVRQFLTLNPQPTTIELFVPLVNNSTDVARVSVKEPGRIRPLAEYPNPDADPSLGQSALWSQFVDDDSALIGVSGRGAMMRALESRQIDRVRLAVGFLEQRFLPAAPIGFDSLDVLVLNAPDLGRMDVERQQAIADWVRAGGSLVFWPGDDPWPSAGPLLDILPGPFGAISTIELSEAQLTTAGLPNRFKSLKTRALDAPAGWERVPLFGKDGVSALRRRVGFGQVLASPVDLGLVQFDNDEKAHAFWEPLLKPLLPNAPVVGEADGSIRPRQLTRDARGATAVASLVNRLGDVPGAGRFDFTYVVVVLVAMMLLVGPIDYFVLRKLGRQQWTWATTAAWIVLITAAALTLGRFLRSGELYYRTLRLVDQADDGVVATTDLVGVYSPRSTDYELDMRPETWWRPASPLEYGFRRNLLTEWDAGQTYRGNSLAPMYINVWNLRFARGRTFAHDKPLVAADLALSGAAQDTARRLTGTLTNLSNAPMSDLRIRTHAGHLQIDRSIAPGETIPIDGPLTRTPVKAQDQEDALMAWRRSRYGETRELEPHELATAAGDLAPEASMQIDQFLDGRDDLACVYAMTKAADASVKLLRTEPIQEHWLGVRALVNLKPTPSAGK